MSVVFERRLGEELFQEHIKSRVGDLIAPEPLDVLINRARALDWEQPDKSKPAVKTDKGSNAVHVDKPVMIEIGNAIIRHYLDSMKRMFPRVAAISLQKNHAYSDAGPAWIDVKEEEVPVSHPMDVFLRKLLVEPRWSMHRSFLSAVIQGTVQLSATDAPVSSIPAVLEFAPGGKLWHWVKATPPTSTREQVATTLFGKPEEAHRLIAMSPLWGFRSTDIRLFTEPSYDGLVARVASAKDNPDPTLRPTDDVWEAADLLPPLVGQDTDPVAELVAANDHKYGPDRAKQAAPKSPGPKSASTTPPEAHDEANIVDVQQSNLKNLADLDKLIPLFRRPTASISAARTKFQARMDEAKTTCIADTESAYAFAQIQRGYLSRIALGIGDAALRLVQGGGATAPESVRSPLEAVVDAFIAGLTAIELPELAEQRLANADVLARDIDITLQEAALHERLGELEGEIDGNNAKRDKSLEPWAHKDRLEDYAMQLAGARMGMRDRQVATQAKVAELKPKVDDLGFDIGISEKLARLNAMWAMIDNEQDIWESGLDRVTGKRLKDQNRAIYLLFKRDVFDVFKVAEAKDDPAGKQAAAKAYNDLLTGSLMQEHADTVRDFLQQVAKHKKWTKLIVSLAIAFVAFGLGQWEFGAVLAAEGTLFEAAVVGGLVTTTTSAVLNKVIFHQNPTVVGVLTSFMFNAGTFFVIGKLALAAKAAGAEIALAEGTTEAKALAEAAAADTASTAAGTASTGSKLAKGATAVGNYAVGLGKEAVIEFGLGELHDGTHVIIVGEPNAVDWAALPGIKPAGHTHPLHPGNDLRPDIHNKRQTTMTELLDPSNGSSVSRATIFPTVEDFVVMAGQAITGHRVFTGFVHDRGIVRKPNAGESAEGLEFTIGKTKQIGTTADGKRVFESTIEARAGTETPITERKIWIVEDVPGGSGHLYMSEPGGVVRAAPATAGGKPGVTKTRTGLTPELEKLVPSYGKDAVSWAAGAIPDEHVKPFLDAMHKLPAAERAALEKLPATDARDVINRFTPERVKLALGGPTFGASDLVKLLKIPEKTARDLLDFAKSDPKRLEKLARYADAVEAGLDHLTPLPLEDHTVILDSGARIAIDLLIRGQDTEGRVINGYDDLRPSHQKALTATRRALGMPTYADPPAGVKPTVEWIVGKNPDLRMGIATSIETVVGERMPTGAPSSVRPQMKGMEADTSHPDYALLIDDLKTANVGGQKGAVDRSQLAEALLASRNGKEPATIVAVDEDFVVNLAKFADQPTTFTPRKGRLPTDPKGTDPPTFYQQLRTTYPGGSYEITIRGHRLRVHFQ